MKLYLSSNGAPSLPPLHHLLGKRKNIAAASIRTAWEPYAAAGSPKVADWEVQAESLFDRIGATAEIIDLTAFQGRSDELFLKLAPLDLVWLHGGNSFYLNYWAAQCNFKEVMQELLARGLVYAGDSAGAVVAGPNLHGIEFADDPAAAPQTIFESFHFVDFAIVPHWGNPRFQPTLEKVKAEAEQYNPQVLALDDAECLTVHNGNVERHAASVG